MLFSILNTADPAKTPLTPQRKSMSNAVINDDLDESFILINPTFKNSRQSLNETEVDIEGNSSFYATPYPQMTTKPNHILQEALAQLSGLDLEAGQSDNVLEYLREGVLELNRRLLEKTEEFLRIESITIQQQEVIGKLQELLKGNKAKYASLKEDATLQNEKHEKTIITLKEYIYGMKNKKEKYKEEIQNLRTKVSNLVSDMNQMKTKYEDEIRDLRVKILKYEPSPYDDNAYKYQIVQEEEDDPEYTRLRELARAEAKKRSACYDASRAAYNNREGTKAKELLNEGKSHHKLMEKYNKKAADLVFKLKNAHLPPTEIDLHGLFVEEASEKVRDAIQRCQQMQFDYLTIIVGQGQHSPGQIPKLKPAIAKVLKQYKVSIKPNQPNKGCILVKFDKGASDPA